MKLDFFATLRQHLQENPDRIVFQSASEEKEPVTYRQVGAEIRALSQHLKKQGISAGDMVGLLMESRPRWPIAFFSALSAGATIVPLDILHSPATLAKLISHAECRLLFCSERLLPVLEQIFATLPKPLPVVILGRSGGRYPEWDLILLEENDADVPIPLVERNLDDPTIVMYTSGTTGEPKGVVLARKSFYTNIVEALKRIEVGKEDHFLSVLPLYHILALVINVMIPFYVGCRVTFLDVLDAGKILGAFRERGISIFVCVPQFYYVLHRRIFQGVDKQAFFKRFIFYRLLAISRFANNHLGLNPGKWFFRSIHRRFGPSLRYFGVGGARFDPHVARSLRDLGFTLVQAYGMTETASLATITPVGKGVGSAGTVLPHVEVRIVDPDEMGIGRVLIRGDNIMKGYLKNDAATREVIDSDGWLDSGDLGYMDRDGFLYITGRAKDVIVLSSGKNIYPEEIEHFYQQNCPYIKEMCVLGVTDDSSGTVQERLHAVIVPDFDRLRAEKVANAYDMIRYLLETLSQKLPGYKRVHSLEIWQEPLPRTTTRKIKRYEVERLYRGESRSDGLSVESSTKWGPQTPIEKQVVEMIRRVKKEAVVTPRSSLELDLSFDSLERVELISSIQDNFGIEIADEEAAELLTVEDILSLVARRTSESGGEIGKGAKSWDEILKESLSPEDQVLVYERLRRRFVVELIFILVTKVAWLLGRLLFRLKATGREHLPRQYPFMICPNHLSFLDAFLVAAVLPSRVIRRWFSLGYADYFSRGIAAWLGRLVKTVPVDPDVKLRQALRLGAEGLSNGLVLCIFPEGERSIDGSLKEFKKGPAILASKLKIPVVPAGIRGTYEAWRRGSGRIRLHPVQIRFGKAIVPREGESVEQFNQRLRDAVLKLQE